jgi:hypothetical protein
MLFCPVFRHVVEAAQTWQMLGVAKLLEDKDKVAKVDSEKMLAVSSDLMGELEHLFNISKLSEGPANIKEIYSLFGELAKRIKAKRF